ncbi:hypothetical protein ACFLEY_02200 [Bradyrhizobium sp. YCK136]|uniref:hypothetical protein n=1 Tax=Bradyrhizobium sp. YCK136 TaxID=3351346 RepID=UPI0037C7A5C9
MGKWLDQLRESAKTLGEPTDKTDKTAPGRIFSVLSNGSDGVLKITPDGAVASVSFVGRPSDPFHNFPAFNNRYAWDDDDWQAAFDERAAILEFDQGMPREEAEPLAWRQIEAERKRSIQ